MCVVEYTATAITHTHILECTSKPDKPKTSILRHCTPAQTDGESQHVFRNWMPLYLSGIYPHPTPRHLPSVANATGDTVQRTNCKRSAWSDICSTKSFKAFTTKIEVLQTLSLLPCVTTGIKFHTVFVYIQCKYTYIYDDMI